MRWAEIGVRDMQDVLRKPYMPKPVLDLVKGETNVARLWYEEILKQWPAEWAVHVREIMGGPS